MKPREYTAFVLLTAVFVAGLVIANVLAGKIISVWEVYVPAGVLAYSITFAITDTMAEIWGRARAQTLVNAGFVVLLLVWGLVALAIHLPPAPYWRQQEAFAAVLGATNRIILASLIAYAVSQSFDVWIFHRLKQLLHSRHLWLRNNVSTLIAFYGQYPVLPLIAGQLTVKYAIAVLDTPLVYGLVYLVRLRIVEAASPPRAE